MSSGRRHGPSRSTMLVTVTSPIARPRMRPLLPVLPVSSHSVALLHGRPWRDPSAAGRAGTSRAGARCIVKPGDWSVMIRMLLVLAVIALGADALLNNGGYTQAAWHQLQTIKLEPTKDAPPAQRLSASSPSTGKR